MNILQLVPKLNIGGVEKSTIEASRFLVLNGHKSIVVSGGGRMERDLAAIGVRHYTLPVGKKSPITMIYSYFKLKGIIKKENIDIVHGRSRIPALIGYFAARKTRKAFITTAHGQYKKHLISRVMGWGRRVIVANELMARHMKDNFGVSLHKMVIIPRGVDLKKFSFVAPSERRGKVFRVGMICRFTPLKGHLDFIKAISYVSRKVGNLEVVLMGDRATAKEDYIKKIELAIRRLMVGKIVNFVDSTEDVAEVMNKLDVLVSANSEQEAFGRSIIEAQARGVPVVATRVGGVADNIEHEQTGLLCEPMDPSDMAKKIMQYIEDREFMEKVAYGGRNFVERNYSLERVMALTLDAYKRVLSSKNILVLKISSLGDIILSIPSLRSLRKKFKDAVIKVLVDVKFREVLDRCPYIDEVITCDFSGRDRGLGFLKLANRLRSEDFNISVDLQNNKRSHLLAFLSAIHDRYGYNNRKWSKFLNHKVNLPEKPMKPVEHQLQVLQLMGITSLDDTLKLWPGEESKEWAKNFLKSNWLKKDQKLIAMSISASERWKTKNWPLASMINLSEMLAKKKGMRTVLIGTKNDKEIAAEFMKKSTSKPIDAVGKTSISNLISIIERCDVLITGDSSPMHISGKYENTLYCDFWSYRSKKTHAQGRKIPYYV